jgi:hypothetical protein
LVISSPYTSENPLDLGGMQLSADVTSYVASAAFRGIQVWDSRREGLPYTVTAVASPFLKVGGGTPGPTQIINARNVGLTSISLVSTNALPATFLGGVPVGGPTAGQNLTGFDNPPAPHLPAGATGPGGLGVSTPIFHANQGAGTTELSGVLSIDAPTGTEDGTYRGTVTFTVMGE